MLRLDRNKKTQIGKVQEYYEYYSSSRCGASLKLFVADRHRVCPLPHSTTVLIYLSHCLSLVQFLVHKQ